MVPVDATQRPKLNDYIIIRIKKNKSLLYCHDICQFCTYVYLLKLKIQLFNCWGSQYLGTDHYFSGGGMRNMEKNCLQGLKRQNKVFANTICVWKMFAGKSDKPSKILVSKLIQIITESNKLTQGHKNMELGTSKFSFYNTEINDKVKNSWFFVPIYSQHYLLTFCPIKLHRVFSKLYETK